MDKDLYKVRSLAKCVQAAYNLLSTNLKHLVRRTWMPALAYAITLAWLYILINNYPALADVSSGRSGSKVIWISGVVAACILNLFAIGRGYTHVVSLLNGRTVKSNFPRVAKLIILALGIIAMFVVLSVAMAYFSLLAGSTPPTFQTITLTIAAEVLAGCILMLCLLPTFYTMMKYFMEHEQPMGIIFGKAYRKGWRHRAFLFTLLLLVCIIAFILLLITVMPMLVLQTAVYANAASMDMGDASGMPSYFSWLMFATALVCSFIWFYIMIWQIMVFYYAYGSIEGKEKIKEGRA